MSMFLWLTAAACFLATIAESATAFTNREDGPLDSARRHQLVWGPRFPNEPRRKSTESGRIKIPLRQPPHFDGWVADMAFGFPPQDVSMLIDTLSFTTWVINFDFGSGHHFYNHSQSHTYIANETAFDQDYPGVSGFLSLDNLIITDDNVFMGMEFAEVDNTQHMGMDEECPFDGVVGLGFQNSNISSLSSPFAQIVRDKRVLDEPVYAFYLSRSGQGELTIGGVEKKYYQGDVSYHNVILGNPWALHLESVQAGDLRFTSPVNKVVVSLFSPYVIGPKDQVDQLAKLVGADGGSINCDASPPDISFTIDGTTYTVTKDDYLLPIIDNECMFGFIGVNTRLPGDPVWWLGGVFMRRYYSVFDFGTNERVPRIGFALAVDA